MPIAPGFLHYCVLVKNSVIFNLWLYKNVWVVEKKYLLMLINVQNVEKESPLIFIDQNQCTQKVDFGYFLWSVL